MVRAVMKRVVEDVTSMEDSTALLFDDDANSARNSGVCGGKYYLVGNAQYGLPISARRSAEEWTFTVWFAHMVRMSTTM
jgi:hypothetical protein